MRDDLYHSASPVRVVDPDTVTADKAADNYVDMLGYESALILITVGATGDTIDANNYIAHKVEECDTSGGSYTAVARSNIMSGIAAGTAGEISLVNAATHTVDSVIHAHVRPTMRYLKIRADVTGTHTNGTPQSICVVRLGKKYQPATA